MPKIRPDNIGKVKDNTAVKGGSFVLPSKVKPTEQQMRDVAQLKKELKQKEAPKKKATKKVGAKKGGAKKVGAKKASGKTFLDMMTV